MRIIIFAVCFISTTTGKNRAKQRTIEKEICMQTKTRGGHTCQYWNKSKTKKGFLIYQKIKITLIDQANHCLNHYQELIITDVLKLTAQGIGVIQRTKEYVGTTVIVHS